MQNLLNLKFLKNSNLIEKLSIQFYNLVNNNLINNNIYLINNNVIKHTTKF